MGDEDNSMLLMILLLSLTACIRRVTTTETVPVLRMTTQIQTITVTKTQTIIEGGIFINHISSGSLFASFSGVNGLPDGILLLSQMYEGGKRQSWWPSNETFAVQDEK